jgi:cbb3-type cytochrome oxidase subunit 3
VSFVGWAWWAYDPRNAARHEAAGRIPFENEGGDR